MEVNTDLLMRGLKDGLGGAKSVLTEEQIKETMNTFQKEMMEKQQAAQKEQGEKNKAEGEKFLAENKKKDGVVTTASGLQYTVLKEGTGPKPGLTDKVKVHYHGTLIDGRVFDSSVDRGQPIELSVNGVIPGWTEALQLMPVGSKYRLWLPAKLAYGEQGTPGGPIGPNATLVFDVELLEIAKAPR